MSVRRWWSVSDLTLAAALWGFGFIATVWALRALNAYEITLVRFLIAVLLGFPFLFATPLARREWKVNLHLSFLPAILLCGTLILQTWGLNFTTATKSGFITTLYVVMVPVLDALIDRRRISGRLLFFIFLAFLGTTMILNVGFATLNVGDLATLGCAIFATLQIYYMGRLSPVIKTPFAFNIGQSLWSILISLPFCLWPDGGSELVEKLRHVADWPKEALAGVLFLALGSTMTAFFLQVRGQAHLTPTVSGILCLLESPFAMLFAILALQQFPSNFEVLGAVLIFLAAVGASVSEVRAPKAA